MKRVLYLFVPSLSGCLLVASLLSSCTGIHGPMSGPAAGEQPPDVSGGDPSPPARVQVGVASWYGKKFHGRLTANGEIYDMYQPTAAHRTAPLGTYALVTSLENGQSIRVRINDRGPHRRHRILDLSYEAARQLDLVRAGSGRVKIEFFDASPPPMPSVAALNVDPDVLRAAAPSMAATEEPTVLEPESVAEQSNSVQVLQTPGAVPFTVQVGAYQQQNNALRARQMLASMYPNVWITVAPENTQALHRVRLGPFQNRDEAERVVRRVKARGYTGIIMAMAPPVPVESQGGAR